MNSIVVDNSRAVSQMSNTMTRWADLKAGGEDSPLKNQRPTSRHAKASDYENAGRLVRQDEQQLPAAFEQPTKH
jgi:hypothetical protein